MEVKSDIEDFGKTFVVLNTDKQKTVLKTAKTLLNVQRVGGVLVGNAEYVNAVASEKKDN
jgi:nitrate reductase NapAB chaperone NapD